MSGSASAVAAVFESVQELNGREAQLSHIAGPSTNRNEGPFLDQYRLLTRYRHLLRGPSEINPFVFHIGEELVSAQGPGLEGFWFTLKEGLLASGYSSATLARHLPDYFSFLDNLFKKSGFCNPKTSSSAARVSRNDVETQLPDYRSPLHRLRKRMLDGAEGVEALCRFLEPIVNEARHRTATLDCAASSRSSCTYMALVRSHNLEGLRKQRGDDCDRSAPYFAELRYEDLCWYGPEGKLTPFCNVFRPLGVYAIGEINRKGEGSPFAIKDPRRVNASLGSKEQVCDKIKDLEAHGIRTVFDLVPNHLAIDNILLDELKDPSFFIHTTTRPDDPEHYHEWVHPDSGEKYWISYGAYCDDKGRHYFNDVLQLNLSSSKTRAFLAECAIELITRYGIHGFRVDMAHHVEKFSFEYTWRGELGRARAEGLFPPEEEGRGDCMTDVIEAVKAHFPHTFFIAEAFSGWDSLAVPYDLVYSCCDMWVRGYRIHNGLRDSLLTTSPARIQAALDQSARDSYCVGGAAPFNFLANQDEKAPLQRFGDLIWLASFFTFINPNASMLYAGTEIGYSCGYTSEDQSIPFERPKEEAQISWQALEEPLAKHIYTCIWQKLRLEELAGERLVSRPMRCRPMDAQWVGSIICGSDAKPGDIMAIALGNLGPEQVVAHVLEPALGIDCHIELPPCGIDGQRLVILGE